jgi:hypothetical protein
MPLPYIDFPMGIDYSSKRFGNPINESGRRKIAI